jgi:hypothetical protein
MALIIEDAIKRVLSAVRTFGGAKTLKEFKQLRSEIFLALEVYANIDTSIETLSHRPQLEVAQEAKETYLQFATRLVVYKNLPFHTLLGLPSAEYLGIAKANLVQLSRESGKPEAAVANYDRQANVREALKTTWGARKIKKSIAL